MEWRTKNGSKAWICYYIFRFYYLVLLILLIPYNAYSLEVNIELFDIKCNEFIHNIDNSLINDDELSFIVGYLSNGSDISEEDFNYLLNIIYNLCKNNINETLGDVLDSMIEKSNK